MGDFDKSSKWLVENYGSSALRVGGAADVVRCRAGQAEVVQPRQLPDGLLEVWFEGRDDPDLVVLEVATYPERRIASQVLRDITLVEAARGVLPEVLVLVLHPKGNLDAAAAAELESRLRWTRLQANWRVVKLWTVPAADLLELQDVGVIPWVPLSSYTQSPETIIRQCRRAIDRLAPVHQHANLLAVTQVLARLRYNEPQLLQILGGKQTMIESPLIQELVEKAEIAGMSKLLLRVGSRRFGPPNALEQQAVEAIHDAAKLEQAMAHIVDVSSWGELLARLN